MGSASVFAFNRGEIDSKTLPRIDIERMRLGAETQTNWMPRTLGRMMFRPGTAYKATARNSNEAIGIPFIYATSDTALLEASSDGFIRVLLSGTAIAIGSVSSSVSNGTFDSDISSWTDNSETGAAAAFASGGYADLTGTGFNAAILDQQITVSACDTSVEHFIKVVIQLGPVTLRVGSSAGDDSYVTEIALGTGTHFFSVTPSGDIHIRLMSILDYSVLVDSCEIASSGTLELPTPWNTAALVKSLRWDQSGDVIYVASTALQQRKILRYATRSWGVALYQPEDGPFLPINTTGITMTPTAVRGDTTLTASRAFFATTHVGALIKITSAGQDTSNSLSGANQAGDTIRVTGLDADNGREFTVVITGTWAGTIDLEYSVNEEGSWVVEESYTTNQNKTFTGDNDDNVIKYWRLNMSAYTSGTAVTALSYSKGGTTGVFHILARTSATVVTGRVLSRLGGTSASVDWYESVWSDKQGWPSAVALYESRLCWAGKTRLRCSVTDAFESFDDETLGDSGPVARSLGRGPVDTINAIIPLQKLVLLSEGAEIAVKSNSFDEPLTPDNANLKAISTQGSKTVPAAKVDDSALFIQKSGLRVYEIGYEVNAAAQYATVDRSVLVPEIGGTSGFLRMAVQRQPDTRIWCVRSDGQCAVLVWDKAEEVYAWIRVLSDAASGEIEDVVVLPSSSAAEDEVWLLVKRTINSATARYWELMSLESECVGGNLNKNLDSHIVYDSTSTTSMTGLSHLEGETVYIWADGANVGTKTVSSGALTLDTAASQVVMGLYYKAQYKSRKLVEAATEMVSPLNQPKQVAQIGFTLANAHHKGVRYGADFTTMYDIPQVKGGNDVSSDAIHTTWEEPLDDFGAYLDQDARICLQAESPKPCTITSMSMQVHQYGKN